MITIEKILKSFELDYLFYPKNYDEASWEIYETEIEEALKVKKQIVGIELGQIPEIYRSNQNVKLIDHHGDKKHLKSSLHQLLSIDYLNLYDQSHFTIRLSEEEFLTKIEIDEIAWNDVGHIKLLEEKRVSNARIKEIRSQDLKAQGYRQHDLFFDEEDRDAHSIQKRDDLVLVETNYEKFGSITDHFYNSNILIYNTDEFWYYGNGDSTIRVDLCISDYLNNNNLEDLKVVSGGKNSGYIGLPKGSNLTIEDFKNISESILKYHNKTYFPHSVHFLIMPFMWKSENPDSSTKMDTSNLEEIQNIFLKEELWNRDDYFSKFDTKKYNERKYFFSYMHSLLFDYGNKNDNNRLNYFSYTINKSKENLYKVYISGKNDPYNLEIEGIYMHLYDNGIGFFIYELNNFDYSEKEDILIINDYIRRMQPSFLSDLGDKYTSSAQKIFLPEKIEVILNNEVICSEDYECFNDLNTLKQKSPLPQHIEFFFPNSFILKNNSEFTDSNSSISQVSYSLIGDDRMFLMCIYNSDEMSRNLSELKWSKYNFESSDFWYAFLFADKSHKDISIQNTKMKLELILKHTYARWAGYGTLYGLTEDTFVCITNLYATEIPLLNHFTHVYYHIALMNLLQKSSLVYFSQEITSISQKIKKNNSTPDEQLIVELETLNLNYIEFRNRIYYRNISPQIQGREIYKQYHSILEIDQEVKDLGEEINSLYKSVAQIQQNKLTIEAKEQTKQAEQQSKEALKLTQIATWFLPPSLVASVMAIGFLNKENLPYLDNIGKPDLPFWFSFIIWVLLSISIYFLMTWILKKMKNKGK